MKLTKKQQQIINEIKTHGRLWVNPRDRIYRSFQALADKGVLTWKIDGNGVWFDLV